MNFIIGLLTAVAGITGMYYSDQLAKFGSITWAENNLGGTRQMYVLVGFIIVVLGLMIMFGLADVSADPTVIQISK